MERKLDPARTAEELERRVRGLSPHVGTYLALEDDERLGVTRAAARADGPAQGALEAEDDELVLGTAAGGLRILAVKPAGKREMPAADYLRGNPSPRLDD